MALKDNIIEIGSFQVYTIDLASSGIEAIAPEHFGTDFNDYLKGLISIITMRSSGRSFIFQSDTTEVRSQIPLLLNPLAFEAASETIASRLLLTEQATQERMARLNVEIQKGIIIQAVVTDNGVKRFVLCKADHNEFLDELHFRKARGLPIKKLTYLRLSHVASPMLKKSLTSRFLIQILLYPSTGGNNSWS
ncbi:MAG: hypothetical protein IPN44_00135 [Flavobacteriales bacterium]|nr:hypothetical protein [Flavobacteriales bacterium]